MINNDMSVDLGVFLGLISRIQSKLDALYNLSDIMSHNLAVAGQGFDTANYRNAEGVILDMQRKLADAIDRANALKNYLNRLMDSLEEYLALRCNY